MTVESCCTAVMTAVFFHNAASILGRRTLAVKIAMAEGGAKRPLEEKDTRHLASYQNFTAVFTKHGKTILSFPCKNPNVRKRQKPEKTKMEEILLCSKWILVDGVPYYQLEFLSGRTKTCLDLIFLWLFSPYLFLNRQNLQNATTSVHSNEHRRPMHWYKNIWQCDSQQYDEIYNFVVDRLISK